MKKLVRDVALISSAVAIPFAINKYIFSKFNEAPDFCGHKTYKWFLGDIKYKVKGEGEPLLLIHGIYAGASSDEFHKNIDLLCKKYKVYSIDLLGFGASAKPNITYSPYLYISLINSFIKEVIKQPTNVIASSVSADYVVMAYNFDKHNFKKLIFIAPTGINFKSCSKWYNPLAERMIDMPILGTLMYNGICSKKYIEKYLATKVFSPSYKMPSNYVQKLNYMSHYGGVGNKYPMAKFVSGQLHLDVSKYILNVKAPLCIVWGEDDQFSSINDYYLLETKMANVSLYKFGKCKMVPHIEYNAKFNSMALKFLS